MRQEVAELNAAYIHMSGHPLVSEVSVFSYDPFSSILSNVHGTMPIPYAAVLSNRCLFAMFHESVTVATEHLLDRGLQ